MFVSQEYYSGLINQLLGDLKNNIWNEKDSYCIEQLSAPFIPAHQACFLENKLKILIVGQETRGWLNNHLKQLIKGELSVDAYIENSQKKYKEILTAHYKTRSSFVRFCKKIDKILPKENVTEDLSIQWLNFYLCCFKKSSPSKLNKKSASPKLYKIIVEHSLLNLSSQIKKLSPNVIVFCGGFHGNFTALEQMLQAKKSNIARSHHAMISRYDWDIPDMSETIKVVRVLHPAARVKTMDKETCFTYIQDSLRECDKRINHKIKQ